jgi:hypothetical protein
LDAFNNITGKPGADGKPDFDKEYFQYLADQANMQYGNYDAVKKTDLLKEYVVKNMDFLMQYQYNRAQKISTPMNILIFVFRTILLCAIPSGMCSMNCIT